MKLSRGFIVGFSIGVGAGLMAREFGPAVVKMIRPATKAVIFNGLMLIEKFKEMAAKAQEVVEDLTAEVNVELKKGKRTKKIGRHKKHASSAKDIDEEANDSFTA